jgi:hypothetical protein
VSAISTFWTNTIWYLLLGAGTAAELAYAIAKSERKGQTLAFYFTVVGATLFVEETLLVFLKAYTYYPRIVVNVGTPFDDVIAGNFFSQFSISASLVLVVTRQMKSNWYGIFAVLYGLIELGFLKLGIYRHFWYQTWMTVVMLPIAFLIVRLLYQMLQRGIKPVFYVGYVVCGLFPLVSLGISFSLKLAGIQITSDKVLADPEMSRQLISLSLFFIVAGAMMLAALPRLRLRWFVPVVLGLYALYYGYVIAGLEIIRQGWFLPVASVMIFGTYLFILLLDRLYGHPMRKS